MVKLVQEKREYKSIDRETQSCFPTQFTTCGRWRRVLGKQDRFQHGFKTAPFQKGFRNVLSKYWFLQIIWIFFTPFAVGVCYYELNIVM